MSKHEDAAELFMARGELLNVLAAIEENEHSSVSFKHDDFAYEIELTDERLAAVNAILAEQIAADLADNLQGLKDTGALQ